MNPLRARGRVLAGLLLLPCLALAPQALAQAPAKAQKVVSVEGITEYRLPNNGFRYLLFPDPSSSTVTVNMTIFVGSRHEGYGETGMAHLLEHMLFKGSKLFPQPDKALQKHGAEANGTTWVDRTNYYETMPATDANLEFGIRLEADRLVNSFIKREDLTSEMTVVRNEFEMGENNPENILSQRMMAVAFEWHNYGKSTIGNRSDIERVPIERLQGFYRKHYQPDNAMLVVAGKFDEAKAHALIAETFGALPRPKRVLEKTYTDEPPQDGERIAILRRVGTVPVAGVLYHIPAASHPDYAAVDVLETLLITPPSGRLYKALVETKKATTVGGGSYAWHDPSALEFTARVTDKSTPEEVRDILIKELEQFTAKPATEEEVERARRKLLADRERALTKSKQIAIELSEWAGAGDWRLLFLHRDRLAKVTPKDVDRVAKQYLIPSNRTAGLFYPTKQVARATIPEAPPLDVLLKDYKGGKEIAQGETFDPTPANIEARVKRTTVGEGVKAAVLPKKTRGEAVVARLTLRFGNEKALAGQTTAADVMGPLMMRGTKKYTRQELQDRLDKLGATMSVSSGTGSLTLALQAKRKTLPAVLDLAGEVLRNPTFPEDEFGILQRQSKQGLEKGLTDPQALAGNTFRRKLAPYPKDDVRYTPTIEESIARVSQLTRDQVAKLYAEQLGAAAGELVIVGDFDPEPALKQVEGFLSGWKSAVPYERIATTANTDVKGGRESINTPDKENALYLSGYTLRMKDTAPDYPAMELGNYVVGASGFTSLLMDRLRQKEGWSYGAGSQFSAHPIDELGTFVVYAICNPQNIDKVDGAVLDVLGKALKDGLKAEQLAQAKKGYLEEQKVERGNDARLAQMLANGLFLNRTLQFDADLEDRIAKLTPAEVNEALRRHLTPGRLVIVRAGDFNKGKQAPQK